ncbi:hypothetical protein TRFO_11149 [Tritrichomonas foetus]|uniref:Uncharacterized protein n=1 Tax=Tritrichomonas foetus TaxID=1144522 RepID=A0A1J4J5I7_9EUKA|nr:hypothetical protein TRFO_11149 [Tritrichomonas foetus]|eukprot:OHS94506.1 hypothetical protein TRFO_11149 [Tritrichomonas foetus]
MDSNSKSLPMTPLQSLPSLSPNMPTIYITMPTMTDTKQEIPNEDMIQESFSCEDDLSILRTLRSFYGQQFNGQVPQAFWQIYLKTSNSSHSSNSLSRHWKLSMLKKYGSILKNSGIDECLKLAEIDYQSEKANSSQNSPDDEPTENTANDGCSDNSRNVLIHTQSHKGLPPEFDFPINAQNSEQSSKLIKCSTERPQPINPELPTNGISKFIRNFSTPTVGNNKKMNETSSLAGTRNLAFSKFSNA